MHSDHKCVLEQSNSFCVKERTIELLSEGLELQRGEGNVEVQTSVPTPEPSQAQQTAFTTFNWGPGPVAVDLFSWSHALAPFFISLRDARIPHMHIVSHDGPPIGDWS